jgi:DNA adenine methylase
MVEMMKNEKYATVKPGFNASKIPKARAPFGYYGAKLRVASRIVRKLPPHNAWVEAFCGSAALTLAKEPAPIEIINDLDGQIINLFQQLRNNAKALCRLVALTPYARAEFQYARKSNKNDSPLERARKFLVASMMTINGTVGSPTKSGFSFSQSYARHGREARVNRWYNLPERLSKVAERLRSVRVENRDARELLKIFSNRPATLVYLDPPYFINRRHRYAIDTNDEQFHRELLEICSKARCMILISGYNNVVYSKLLSSKNGWQRYTVPTTTRDTKGRDYCRTEVLWKNKYYIKAEKTGRVPIRLSAKEKAENKINPPRRH